MLSFISLAKRLGLWVGLWMALIKRVAPHRRRRRRRRRRHHCIDRLSFCYRFLKGIQ